MILNIPSIIKESSEFIPRILIRKVAIIIMALSFIISIIHVWFNTVGLIDAIKKNAFHLGMMLGLAFLIFPARSKSKHKNPSFLDWILSFLGLGSGIYIIINLSRYAQTTQALVIDYIAAIITVLLVLEVSRRGVGLVLPLLAIAFILYVKYGQIFPGVFAHQGFSWTRILSRMYLTDTGLYGITVSVSASYVFMFVMFGSFLGKSGTACFFNDFALAIAGRFRGGPAKVAIFASGLMGSISGSAQSNVATTGAFTIPLMKRIGYTPRFAGGIEASASTGGILMPPIMGAATFIMSSFLGIPYVEIMYAGIIPALFYYFAIFMMVDTEAVKLKLAGIDKSQLPNLKDVIKERGHLITPL